MKTLLTIKPRQHSFGKFFALAYLKKKYFVKYNTQICDFVSLIKQKKSKFSIQVNVWEKIKARQFLKNFFQQNKH